MSTTVSVDTISLRKGHLFGFYSNALNTLMSEFVHACGADAFQEAAEEMSKLQGNVFLTARGREIWKTEQALFRQ